MSNLAATLRHPASALLLIATLGLLACGEPPAPPGPRVGETFPALDLPALDGPPLNLGDYRGRVLVLNVWATWCAPCREEMPSLQRLSERFPSGRFAVVGLTVDEDTNLAREFLLKYGIRFPSASDPARTSLGTADSASSVDTIITGTVKSASVKDVHKMPPVPNVGMGSASG